VVLSWLKRCKASGKTGILPGVLLCGGPVLQNKFFQLMRAV